MSTLITPRMQRAFDYASQEAFAACPSSVPALAGDFRAMLQKDLPEREVILVLLSVVRIILESEEAQNLVLAFMSDLGYEPQ